MHLKFVESESAFSYFASTREYLEQHGKPVAFYSDKHSIFRVARKGAIAGDGMTQFGRALHDLNIDIICADTPQAKGRVERANRTLQDRLVKEMRLIGIDSIETGNLLLPAFLEDYNARFAKLPRNPKDLHRPLAPGEDLGDVFAWREERTISAALTVQYDKVLFILEPNNVTRGLVRKRVTISDYPDGRLVIAHNGLPLPYRIFDKVRQVSQGAIVDNKRLSAALAMIKEQQELAPPRRSRSTPGRRSQSSHLFALPPPSPGPEIALPSPEPETLPELREMWLPEAHLTPSEPSKDAPLLADSDLPAIVGDFRLFNRYVVQRRVKKSGRIGAKRKKKLEQVTPELIDALPAGEGRLSAALALDRFYREAA